MSHEPTAFHSPTILADARAAKVAKSRPIGRRGLTADLAEEALQAHLKSKQPPPTPEERGWRAIAILGCVLLVVLGIFVFRG